MARARGRRAMLSHGPGPQPGVGNADLPGGRLVNPRAEPGAEMLEPGGPRRPPGSRLSAAVPTHPAGLGGPAGHRPGRCPSQALPQPPARGSGQGSARDHARGTRRFIATAGVSGRPRTSPASVGKLGGGAPLPRLQCSAEPQGGTAAQPTAAGPLRAAAPAAAPAASPARGPCPGGWLPSPPDVYGPRLHPRSGSGSFSQFFVHFCPGSPLGFRLELLPCAPGAGPHGRPGDSARHAGGVNPRGSAGWRHHAPPPVFKPLLLILFIPTCFRSTHPQSILSFFLVFIF